MEKEIQTRRNADTKTAAGPFKALFEKRDQILLLAPEEALDRILDAPQPAALVHTFSQEDFYFLVHDIGPQDALALLSLASDRQIDFILDVGTWEKDRMDLSAVTRWFDLLLKSDPERFLRRFTSEQVERIEFYLYKNLEVVIREHDQDPGELGDDFFTLDDVFYIRLIDRPSDPVSDKTEKERREEFVTQFLRQLAAFDHKRYQQVLLEAAGILPAEIEEEAYRLRNVRLAEKGFLPFDEALGIYRYLKPEDLAKKELNRLTGSDDRPLPVPAYSAGLNQGESLFAKTLQRIDETDLLQKIQVEFAGLCNRIVAADQIKIENRDALRHTVAKACDYISIGLERLSGGFQKPSGKIFKTSAGLILKHPLADIFRVGFGQVLALKWRAEKWRKSAWFESRGLPLAFWGEHKLGVLGGLLIKKPLFYDNYQSGVLYRDFKSTAEIRSTERDLDELIAVDRLLALMDIDLRPVAGSGRLDFQNLMLTVWARFQLGLPEVPEPLDMSQFRQIYARLWDAQCRPARIRDSAKESFLSWAATSSGLTLHEVSRQMGDTFEALFAQIAAEYRQVAPGDLDPKYLRFFLVDP